MPIPSPLQMLKRIPGRSWFLVMCGMGMLIAYADRSNMAVAVVAIAKEFNYTKEQQGWVLSAFFMGYIITPILGGALADRHGGKHVLITGAIVWTACTLLAPLAAQIGLGWLVVTRVVLGLGEGVAYPSLHSMIGKWSPPNERSTAVATITAFGYMGPVLALPISSALVGSAWGWRSVFWFFGVLGVVWITCWQFWGASTPAQCSWISERETDWIQARLESDVIDHNVEHVDASTGFERGGGREEDYTQSVDTDSGAVSYHRLPLEEHSASPRSSEATDPHPTQDMDQTIQLRGCREKRTPWKQLLKRREVWAIIVSQFCNSFGFFIFQSWIPTFYLDNYGVDVSKIGYYAVLPSIMQGVMGLTAGFIGDKAIRDWKFSALSVRRFGQVVGSIGLGIFLLLAVFFANSASAAMILITIGMTLNGFTMIGASAYQ
ncbi:hypothetical protein BGW38_005421, partial [Lunasporangiospora selenospora]